MEHDCLFCKIANGDSPSEFLFENEDIIVIRDLYPQAPVHLLLIPKKHIRSINDITEPESHIVSGMIMTAREMAKKEKVAESGYKLIFNVEKGGGQVIFHLHMHLMGGWKESL